VDDCGVHGVHIEELYHRRRGKAIKKRGFLPGIYFLKDCEGMTVGNPDKKHRIQNPE
jgi:hypothetical protein